jgi:hypothetical protein
MRFEKDGKYLEIAQGISADKNGKPVWCIETDLDQRKLPESIKMQVEKTDREGYKRLKNAVIAWAKRKGFEHKN